MDKEQLLEIACQLLIEMGIKSTTMDDIARRAGISKKTLYKHFKDKTDLIRSGVLYVSANLNKEVYKIIQKENNPIKALYQVNDFFSRQLILKANSPQKQLQKYYPNIYKELLERQVEEIGDAIIQNLQTGISLGLYRTDINRDFAMRLYMHIMIEAGNQLYFLTEKYDEDTISRVFLEYHIRAIATPKGVSVLENILQNKF